MRSLGLRFLSLLGLWVLALPQSILDLVGRNPAFLVAHSISGVQVLVFVVALVLVPPLIPWSLERGLQWWLRREPRWVQGVHVGLLFFLILLPYARKIPQPLGALVVALLGAVVLGWSHGKWPAFPPITALLSLSSLLIIGLFFRQEGIRSLVQDGAAKDYMSLGKHSVSLLIFDELSLVSLLDEREEIDPVLFPNFAALASTSTWYRNASTPADFTEHAVPSILTGTVGEVGLVATAADHPINLFTLLGDYEVYAWEPITLLSPEGRNRFRTEVPTSPQSLWTLLGFDLLVVSGHLLLPPAWSETLPAIDEGWVGFWRPSWLARAQTQSRSDRVASYRQFLKGLEKRDSPQLLFLHTMLPHVPWSYFPDGREYRVTGGFPGLTDQRWADNPDLVELGRRRYRLQLQMVDGLLGEWMDRQKDLGLWEDSVVALVADHGVSFRAGDSRRFLSQGNASGILNVPCFIKAPDQEEGRIEDRPFSLAGVLGEVLRLAEVSPSVRRLAPSAPSIPLIRPDRALTEAPSDLAELRSRDLEKRLALYPSSEEKYWWNRLSEITPYIGVSEARLPRTHPLPGPEIFVNDFDQFRNIEVETDPWPALLSGTVRGVSPSPAGLAVAVDGILQSKLALESHEDHHRFWTLLSPDVLTVGPHAFSFYEVLFQNGEITFRRLSETESTWTFDSRGNLVSDDRTYPLRSSKGNGWMGVRSQGEGVWVHGWAWDVPGERPVERVLLFAEDHYLATVLPQESHSRARAVLNQADAERSGFNLFLDLKNRPVMREKPILKALAITEDQEVLPLSEGIRLVPDPICEGLNLTPDGESLRREGDEEIPFASEELSGGLHVFKEAEVQGYGYVVGGWFVDEKTLQPAEHLLVFHEDQCIYETRFFYPRQDLVDRYQDEGVRYSRFYFWLNQENLRADELTVVAVSPRGIAQKLKK